MPDCTPSASLVDFLVSLSPALGGLLSAIALWVAARARSTSVDALQTSSEALRYSQPPYPSSSVIVPPDVVQALKKR